MMPKNSDEADEITAIPAIPQVRMTRRLAGVSTPDDDENALYADSIGVVGDWKKAGKSYEIPFSSLYGGHIKNLLAAGRCSSATESMWDVTRVIPVCAVTGEAAGTAAALCGDFDRIDVESLQERLRENGVKVFKKEIFE